MSRHPLARYGAVMGICALAGLIAGAVSGVVSNTSTESTPLGVVLVGVSVAVAMGLGIWASLRWWRGLDEAAQEAHKWAWWWGSTAGLSLAGVVLFSAVYGAPDRLVGDAKDLVLAGAALVALFQMAGYGVAWAAWWLKRR
ncbi:MAG: hypothetical protein KKA16_03565 [Alphaproteobacteria bacterium]|nr:hypothetical protein [Alphaproteobacteria bacterium]MBU2378047.1 hypothetical protein [Alphaproteobacteria bacterium]